MPHRPDNWWFEGDFQRRFLVLFLPYFLLLTVAAMGAYAYLSTYTKQQLKDQVATLVRLQQTAIAKDLSMMFSDLAYLSKQEDLIQFIGTSGPPPQALKAELQAFMDAKQIYGALALFRRGGNQPALGLRKEGERLLWSQQLPGQLGDREEIAQRVYAMGPGEIYLGGIEGAKSSLYFATPLFKQGRAVGAMVLFYSHQILLGDLQAHAADLPGLFMLLDGQGRPMVLTGAEPDTPLASRLKPLIAQLEGEGGQRWINDDLLSHAALRLSRLIGPDRLADTPRQTLETLRVASYITHQQIHRAVGNREDFAWAAWGLAVMVLFYVSYLLSRGRTLQERAWEQVKDQRHLTEEMLDSVPVAVFLKDLSGHYQLCNKEMEHFLGRPAKDVLGKAPDEVLPPGEAQAILASDRAALEQGETTLEEFPIYRGGERMDLLVGKRLIRLSPKEDPQILGFVLDISAQKQAERQAGRLGQAVEQSPASLVITDPEGRIEYVNPAFTRITGYSFEEALGQKPSLLKSGEMPQSTYQKLWERITSGKTWQGEMHNRKKDGSLYWALASISPVVSESGELLNFLGIQEDITARKLQGRELVQAKLAAEAANRAKSDFLANMSHEIRTPLNAVLGYTEILDGLIDDERQRGYLNSIKSAGKGLLTLINDILDLSKIEAGKLTLQSVPTDLGQLINEVANLFGLSLEQKGIRLVKLVDRRLPERLLLDEIRLRQILVNLMGNAIKFTETGEIRILAAPERNSDGETVDLLVRIEDTGVGIAPEALETIFEDFTQQEGQSTKKYGGTGLGLAISQKLVHMMGGEITASSVLGEGSAFALHLPGVKLVEGGSSMAPSLAPAPRHFVPARLLVVDDNPEMLELAKEYFRDSGLSVETAADGLEALGAIQVQKPDLIFTDIKMPQLDGRKLMSRLKGDPRWSGIPVVAVTASALGQSEEDFLRLGFASLLRKPVSRDQLAREVARFIDPAPSPPSDPEPSSGPELSPEDLGAINQALPRLQGELMQRFEAVSQSKLFHEIEAFGSLLIELGSQQGIDPLEGLGRQLVAQAKAFDLAGIMGSLAAYPKLVERLAEMTKTLS